jgi:hypothetical protein
MLMMLGRVAMEAVCALWIAFQRFFAASAVA